MRIRKFSDRLWEFRDLVINGDLDDDYHVMWHQGSIFVNPTQADTLKVFYALHFLCQPKVGKVSISPLDDWSDTKIVRAIQQALSDMIKAGLIEPGWTLTVSDEKETAHSFGSTVVSDVIQLDANYAQTIPICFHGTSSDRIKDIMRLGLWSRRALNKLAKHRGQQNWTKGYTANSSDRLYLTTDWDRAEYYAAIAADAAEKRGAKGAKPVVIEVRDLPVSYVSTDDDYETGQGSMNIMQMLRGQDPSKHDYVKSIRNSGQFSVLWHLPPSMLRVVK